MTPRLLTSLFAVALLSIPVTARTFTNTEGRTIEAEIVRATATTVTLRLANKRTTTIPLTKLSEDDQTHIAEWLATKIPSLRFTPNVTRSNKNKRYEGSSTRSTYQKVQSYEMNVDVRNDENTKGLEASVMKWILVGRSLTENDEYKILAAQDADFSVPVSGRTNIPFRKVINEYYESSTFRSRSGYKCIGYVLYAERKSDKREVYSHATTNQLTEHLQAIIVLESGDRTNEFFAKPEINRPGRPGEDPNAPIRVR